MGYAPRVYCSFMGAAMTVSDETECWCYLWAWADFEQTTGGPGTNPEGKRDIDTYWHQQSPGSTSDVFH